MPVDYDAMYHYHKSLVYFFEVEWNVYYEFEKEDLRIWNVCKQSFTKDCISVHILYTVYCTFNVR